MLAINWKKTDIRCRIARGSMASDSASLVEESYRSHVIYNGQSSSDSSVYRSYGKLLVRLVTQPANYEYVIYPDIQKVGRPSFENFVVLPLCTFGKVAPPPVVFLDDNKIGVKPDLVLGRDFAEFTTVEGARVRAEW